MKTIIYTTVRAEIEHDQPFDNKNDCLEWIMGQDLLDYKNVLGSSDAEGKMRVIAVEILEDEVMHYNTEEITA